MPEGEEEEQDIENLFEKIMKENFPNLVKEIDFQEVQGAQRVKEVGPKEEHTKRHVIIKLPKIKEKRESEKHQEKRTQLPTKEVPIRLSDDFLKETLQARRGWQEIFKVMKSQDLQPR